MPDIVDLGEVKRKRDLQDAERAAAEQAEAIERVQEWERQMQRAFKGIIPRPVRHAFLRRAAARYEREHPDS